MFHVSKRTLTLVGTAVALTFAAMESTAAAECAVWSASNVDMNGSHYVYRLSADELQGGYVVGGGCRFKDSSFSGSWPHSDTAGGAVTGWECEGNGVQGGSASSVPLSSAGGLVGMWAIVCRS